ncbi:unnamed protein product [Oikopleura dioica]|uniref:Major facilitator superfamily (MFS) profile domain-containing protein n=1 Tax=Oikopleura dioica TaxID=34765 RepID=E4Y5V0_OIKDI|nr:unnamed protein product [Oikopleura dioica]
MKSIYFGLGYMGSSIIAYFIPHWQGHALAIGIMAALQLILTFFLPESPSFLVAKKRYKEASQVLEKIAEKTTSDVGADLEEQVREIKQPQKADRSPLDLLKTPATRKVSLNVAFAYCVTVTVYYALSFNVSSLAGSTYVNNAVNGAVETVAYFICIPLIDKFGRRPVTVIFMYIGSIAVLIVMILNETTDSGGIWVFFLRPGGYGCQKQTTLLLRRQ